MRFPDFYIVGAPKCGTTSLYEYLNLHHQIFMPDSKEPSYYCADLPAVRRTRSLETYLSFFKDAPSSAKWGEASPWYLFSRDAVKLALQDNPRAKFIACLRAPADMFVSYHNQLIFNHTETIRDVEQAWRMQAERRARANGDARATDIFELLYSDMCSLGQQSQKLLADAGTERVHFVLFDDIARNARAVYEDMLAFLEVKDDGRLDFPVHNQRRAHKFPGVARFLKNPPQPLGSIKQALKAIVPSPRARSRKIYDALSRPEPKPSLRPEFRHELKEHFANDVRLLETVIGRDLSSWRD